MTRQPPVAPHHLPVLTEVVGHARSTIVIPQEAIVTPLSIPMPAPAAPDRVASAVVLEARIDVLIEQRLRAVVEQTLLDKNSPFRSTLRQEIEKLLKEGA